MIPISTIIKGKIIVYVAILTCYVLCSLRDERDKAFPGGKQNLKFRFHGSTVSAGETRSQCKLVAIIYRF